MQTQYSFPSQATTPALEYVVGRRLVAHLIDVIILGIFQSLILIEISAMGLHSSGMTTTTQGDAYDRFAYWLTHLDTYAVLQVGVITLIPLVYFILMEAVQGATVGKMVLGIRVVNLDGSEMSWGQAIVRNLLRIVDCKSRLSRYCWRTPSGEYTGRQASDRIGRNAARRVER
jgi:uncharacterized RDD family membrane protein YckC